MKKTVLSLALGAVLFAIAPNCMAPDNCMSQPYEQYCTPEPCYDTYCSVPAEYTGDLVNRYAQLADKYKTLGPSERQAAIANNNKEVIELSNLDRHFTWNCDPACLTPDQQLTVKTAQGIINK